MYTHKKTFIVKINGSILHLGTHGLNLFSQTLIILAFKPFALVDNCYLVLYMFF